jgi:hypothetical protein
MIDVDLKSFTEKIRASQNRADAALDAVLKGSHPEPFDFDFDLDRRWATVTAFTTFIHNGRRFRLSIEEEVD